MQKHIEDMNRKKYLMSILIVRFWRGKSDLLLTGIVSEEIGRK